MRKPLIIHAISVCYYHLSANKEELDLALALVWLISYCSILSPWHR
jgi:hypothetical protein